MQLHLLSPPPLPLSLSLSRCPFLPFPRRSPASLLLHGNRRIRAVQLHPMHFDALRIVFATEGKTMGICRGLNSTISRFIAVWCARGFFWVLLKNLGIHFALPCNRRRRRGRERVTCRFSWDSNVCCLESLIPTVGSHLKLTICFRYSVWNCTLT